MCETRYRNSDIALLEDDKGDTKGMDTRVYVMAPRILPLQILQKRALLAGLYSITRSEI